MPRRSFRQQPRYVKFLLCVPWVALLFFTTIGNIWIGGGGAAIPQFPSVRGMGTRVFGVKGVSPSIPAGTVDGDLLLLFFWGDSTNNSDPPTVTDWTLHECGDNDVLDVTTCPSSANCVSFYIWYNSWNTGDNLLLPDMGARNIAQIMGFAVDTWDTADPFDECSQFQDTLDTKTMIMAKVTTTIDDVAVIGAVARSTPNANDSDEFNTHTWGNLESSPRIVQADFAKNTGRGGAGLIQSGNFATAGDTDDLTAQQEIVSTGLNVLITVNSKPD